MLVTINHEELIKGYKSGMSLRQLAIRFNTSKQTIKKRLIKLNTAIREKVDYNRPGVKSADIDLEEFAKLHDDGCNRADLMARFNITTDNTINKLYKKLNLIPHNNRKSRILNLFDKNRGWSTRENLYNLYINQKKSINEISRLYNADSKTVHNQLLRFNVPLRSHKESSKLAANKPESKKKRSVITAELWKRKDYREKITNKLIGSSPQMPPEHRENVGKAMKKLYSDPEFLKQHADKIKKLWENPTQSMLNHLIQLANDLRDNNSDAKKKFMEKIHTNEYQDNLSMKTIQQWDKQHQDDALMKAIGSKCSEAAKTAWKDPSYREKVMSHKKFTSSLELITRGILDDLNIKYRKICPGGYEFDIAIEPEELGQEKGVLIEINGLYFHYKNEKDKEKFIYWKDKLSDRYRFETIWEHEFGAYRSLYDRLIGILEINKEINVNIKELYITEIDGVTAESLYNKYHYLARLRRGHHIGAFVDDKIVAASTFSPITRHESAKRLNIDNKMIKELSRFCINPIHKNKNLASYVLSRFMKLFKKKRPDIQKLITFADSYVKHLGTIYKATNWQFDGMTNSSCAYIRNNYWYNKKRIYDYARSLGIKEAEFANAFGFERINMPPKYRFVYDLSQ